MHLSDSSPASPMGRPLLYELRLDLSGSFDGSDTIERIAHKPKTMLTAIKWVPPVSLQNWDRVWRIVVYLSLLRCSSHVCFVWWQFAVFDLSLHMFDCSLERTGQATLTIY
jgi:hypothetical protein